MEHLRSSPSPLEAHEYDPSWGARSRLRCRGVSELIPSSSQAQERESRQVRAPETNCNCSQYGGPKSWDDLRGSLLTYAHAATRRKKANEMADEVERSEEENQTDDGRPKAVSGESSIKGR